MSSIREVHVCTLGILFTTSAHDSQDVVVLVAVVLAAVVVLVAVLVAVAVVALVAVPVGRLFLYIKDKDAWLHIYVS